MLGWFTDSVCIQLKALGVVEKGFLKKRGALSGGERKMQGSIYLESGLASRVRTRVSGKRLALTDSSKGLLRGWRGRGRVCQSSLDEAA